MWIRGGGEDTYFSRITRETKGRMSDSVKENDWLLSESSFTFGNRYKFILGCQQRGIMWRPAEDSLVGVQSCPFAQAGSSSFWLSAIC